MEPGQSRKERPKSGLVPRVRGIAPEEWATLARAWGGLLLIDVGLRCRGLKRVREWPMFRVRARRRRPSRRCPSGTTEAELTRLFQLVAIAARHHLYPMLCLRRALVLQWLLATRGLTSEVRLGVARGEGGLDAHAWVEREGRVIGEADDLRERYAELTRGGSSA